MVEDSNRFFKKMKELKPYLVEFNENSTIKNKIYVPYYKISCENSWLIMVITHNKYIFLQITIFIRL